MSHIQTTSLPSATFVTIICVHRTVSLCWNVARGSHHQAPVPMTPIRLLNSPWEKARLCRYARLHHSPVTFLPHAGLNCIYSPHIPVFRSTLCRVPTLSWLWSIPRVEDGRGSGEFLWECKNCERSWQLMTGDSRANGHFWTYPNWRIIIALVLVTAQTYTYIYWLFIYSKRTHNAFFSWRTFDIGYIAIILPYIPLLHVLIYI